MKTVKLQVDGMSCASCAKAVEKALCAVTGVDKASVNFVSKTASVDVQDAATNEQSLIDAVKRAGYSAHLPVRDRETEENRAARRQLIKVFGIGALLIVGWALGAAKLVPSTVATGLVIVALVFAAWPIFLRAIKALLGKRLDADVLVAIAVIAASSVGEFVAAAEVAFIMLLGAQLEEYTIRRARRSLGSLLSLVPPTARVRRGGKGRRSRRHGIAGGRHRGGARGRTHPRRWRRAERHGLRQPGARHRRKHARSTAARATKCSSARSRRPAR